MPEPLRLAVVTDIHNGRPSLTKKGPAAIPLLERFADFVATEEPDLVVELGDRITDTDPETDRAALTQVADVFAAMTAPSLHVLGNHDLVHLSVDDNQIILDQDFASASVDRHGWHLVFWQADVRMTATHEPVLADHDLRWLEADLAATDLPSVVFTHVPLDGASMTGNYYFQANPQYATYANVADAQRVISAARVALCVAGHVHWNNVSRIDGVPYLSLQSLTESFTTQDEASASWAALTLHDQQLNWRSHGRDPIELTVDLGGPDRRWTAPLPPFAELQRRS